VTGVGDDGTLPNHAGGSYDEASDTAIRFAKLQAANFPLFFWYTGSRPAAGSVGYDGGPAITRVPGDWQTQGGREGGHVLPGQTGSSGPDYLVRVFPGSRTGTETIRIKGLLPGAGRFDVYAFTIAPASTVTTLAAAIEFLDHLVPGRIADVASTLSAVTLGDHVGRATYVDLDGITRGPFPSSNPLGSLWLGSSGGPTRD